MTSEFNVIDAPQIVTKKRKIEELVNQESLKLAQSFCETPQEWADVQKMNNKKLDAFINDKKFQSNLNLRQTFVDGLHKFYSIVFDKLTRGDNHVASQLMSDISLKKSIESEVIPFLGMLDNKLKLGMLTASGVVAGKMRQQFEQKNFSSKENGNSEETDLDPKIEPLDEQQQTSASDQGEINDTSQRADP